ncbi:unnamed protein product [Phaeothamnion confervicola]
MVRPTCFMEVRRSALLADSARHFKAVEMETDGVFAAAGRRGHGRGGGRSASGGSDGGRGCESSGGGRAGDDAPMHHSSAFLRLFRIKFANEPGVDAGGLLREWFSLAAEALFDPKYGLFCYAATDNLTYNINPLARTHFSSLEGPARDFGGLVAAYRFAGHLLGKALLEEVPLAVHLTRPLYKHLLGLPVTFRDLEFTDRKLYQMLQWVQQNRVRQDNGVDVLQQDFTIMEEGARGKWEVIELKPGGADCPVTDENKWEYILTCTKYRMLDAVSPQLAAFLSAFYDVVPAPLLVVFDHQELELLMCGLDRIDVEDWWAHTVYLGDLRPTHPVVRWFWELVEGFSREQRARLLQFVTGTSRVPVGGFSELQGQDGETRFFALSSFPLMAADADHTYPTAHTCYNRLDLPDYSTKEALAAVLAEVVGFDELATGFQMA